MGILYTGNFVTLSVCFCIVIALCCNNCKYNNCKLELLLTNVLLNKTIETQDTFLVSCSSLVYILTITFGILGWCLSHSMVLDPISIDVKGKKYIDIEYTKYKKFLLGLASIFKKYNTLHSIENLKFY